MVRPASDEKTEPSGSPNWPRLAFVWLMSVTIALTAASLLVTALFNREIMGLEPLHRLLDLNGEGNLSAWYASSLWLLAAAVVGFVAVSKRRSGGPFTWHWFGICAVCVFLSVDEAAMIHETIGDWLDRDVLGSGRGDGWLFPWMYYGIAFSSAFALINLRFLLHLPRPVFRLMVLSGAVFLLGALGLESVSAGIVNDRIAVTYSQWDLLIAGEEFFEMAGVVLFIYSVLTYVRWDSSRVELAAPETHTEGFHLDDDWLAVPFGDGYLDAPAHGAHVRTMSAKSRTSHVRRVTWRGPVPR